MAGVGGAAVPGRLSLAGTEARPTELFSYAVAVNGQFFVGAKFRLQMQRRDACATNWVRIGIIAFAINSFRMEVFKSP
jgi:hypothetical protein